MFAGVKPALPKRQAGLLNRPLSKLAGTIFAAGFTQCVVASSCADASDAKRVPPAHSILAYLAGTRRRQFLGRV